MWAKNDEEAIFDRSNEHYDDLGRDLMGNEMT